MSRACCGEKTADIAGVKTNEWKSGEDLPGKEVHGDLVVIASGRQSAIARCLDEIGIEQPEVTIIDAHIGYASRLYRRPLQPHHPWKAIILQAVPPESPRSGLMFPVEDDRWLVTLIGADRDYPPQDEEGFLEYARSLRDPGLFEAIRNAEPLNLRFALTGPRRTGSNTLSASRIGRKG